MVERVTKTEIETALRTQWLGRRFTLFDSIDSTNDYLAGLEASEANEGTMVLAEFQSAGKGRLGRSWTAPPGSSLLFSLLLTPNWPVDRAQWLMMSAGLAVVRAVRDIAHVDVKLKWPNDIVAGAAAQWRKCGGILLEISVQDDIVEKAVIGIGLNVNISPEELDQMAELATSFRAESGHTINRVSLLAALLTSMEQYYEAAAAGISPFVEWKSALVTIGRTVRARSMVDGAVIEGAAFDTDTFGRLFIRDSAGKVHKLSAGDVTIVS
ncbi:MAG: biotin--[acetyl-CoA-carboxylase] ligase [Candidatus Promineifilaceae bacterium]